MSRRHGASFLVIGRRVLAHPVKDSPKGHHAVSIQAEGCDRRAACGGDADKMGKVVAPHEVRAKAITTRVIKRYDVAGDWIASINLIEFMIIAPLAREREIFGRSLAATRFGEDVLNRKCSRRHARLAPAILTAIPRTLRDGTL
jgi:hypothetical protein